MKLKFKKQLFQTEAVNAVADCFADQPRSESVSYRIDPGVRTAKTAPVPRKLYPEPAADLTQSGFKNRELVLTGQQLLENIHAVQQRQNLPQSTTLVASKACKVNLDIEMETGTGKTYCYIKTMFELNRRFGWSKFIVVVPSVAIREGVHKSLEITAEHFLEQYGKRARFFIYNSKDLHLLEQFSSDSGVSVMIINVQAFNARGKDARRIYEELDDFQSRRPIDVIKSNHPIMILDEPQKLEGAKTAESLKEFNPLAILRYSATHKTEHNKIYRLDALDAYTQKLVKKIAVRGITVRGLTGTNAYLYLESIDISPSAPPVARIEYEVKQQSGIVRKSRKFGKGDNLFDLSGNLAQYKGFVISEIDANQDTVTFTNGEVLTAGEATGDVNEATLRRIQIREAVKAHLEKEQALFPQGIKVLSLFFIDEVAKYRRYGEGGELPGEYAQMFEEEYKNVLNDLPLLLDVPYREYLNGIKVERTHNGYFSIDKKSNRLVDPAMGARSTEADDVDAYDLILKDKESLLSFPSPNDDEETRRKKEVRFIFSHSALSEGWDNPNVFVICTLKHSDSSIRKRQEVGRGLRLCVNQAGDRMDSGADIHAINLLTVVASESYKTFVGDLQKEMSESLSARPRKADVEYFTGKILKTEKEDVAVTEQMAKQIYRYLLKNDYTDDKDAITSIYHEAKKSETLAPLPPELAPYALQIIQLIDSVFSNAVLPKIDDGRKSKANPTNANLDKAEFKALWEKINRKAAYTVHFDTAELIKKCVAALDKELVVTKLRYTVERGEQSDKISYDDMVAGQGFKVTENESDYLNHSIHSAVKYDLIGKLAEDTQLTRKTVAEILKGINSVIFSQYRTNPEDFMLKTARIINEQKATAVVEHLSYDPVEDRHKLAEIFTVVKQQDFSRAVKTERHVYDYVFTDSGREREFVAELDKSAEVVVYAKLPRGFGIPTPVGNYNPDWAIAFKEGKVKHIYFVAETKGSMSSMELRKIEECKIECARKFFAKITSEQVKYDVVDSYAKLMDLVG
ncbi:MAG: restriction endonuclease subunit R [Deltaproteobacteria bacterium RIFOXYD12_FULL_56_24]|nr:MAG: restriction endonuclease subunit R [Deltaproteobacteria bacterium RIFOXYD12_FULL_56_24]